MSTLIADESMKSKLCGLQEAVEVHDDQGVLLGVFKPIGVVRQERDRGMPLTNEELAAIIRQSKNPLSSLPDCRPSDPGWEAAEAACPYSAAELEEMHQQTGGRSLAEIWKSLGQS